MLDSEEERNGRAKEVQEFEVKMEVDESKVRVAPGKKIQSKWVEMEGSIQPNNTMSLVCHRSEHGPIEM